MTPQQEIYSKMTNDQKRRWWIQYSHEPEEFGRLERELAPLLTSKAAKAWLDVWRPPVPSGAARQSMGK